MPLLDLTVDLELDGPGQGWTEVTRDVLVRGGVAWDYGLPGPRPTDTTAQIGECRYQLDNSAANRAGIEGYYAPGHAHARAGFDLGMACRIGLARPWDALFAAAPHAAADDEDVGVRWSQAFSSFLSTDATHAQLIGTSNYATFPAFDRGDGVDRYLRALTLQHDADSITVNLTNTTTGTGDPDVDLTDDAEARYGIAFRDRGAGTVWDVAFATDSNDTDPYALPTTQATLDAIQAVIDDGGTLEVLLYDGRRVRQRKIYYLETLQPTHGPEATRAVVMTGTDYMGIAARAQVGDLPLQQDQRSDQIVETIINALPVQPREQQFAQGQDTYDYALDDLRGERSTALEALHRVTLSEQGYLVADADAHAGETLTFLDRLGRVSRYAASTAPIPMLRETARLQCDRALADVVATVRTGIRIRRVDAGTTTVLYQLGGTAIAIPAGATIHPFGPYRDPAQEAQRVGGANMQTPVSGTDYVANTAADGSGTNVTSRLTVTASFGASGVRWTITNPVTSTVYLTTLQARGPGIYDYARVYLEARAATSTESRSVLTLDLPYQQAVPVAQDIAARLLTIYGTPATRTASVTVHAGRDDQLAAWAVSLGVHDQIDIVDAITGVTARLVIHGVSWQVRDPDDVRVTWGLTPLSDLDEHVWTLGLSTLDETTRLAAG